MRVGSQTGTNFLPGENFGPYGIITLQYGTVNLQLILQSGITYEQKIAPASHIHTIRTL